MHKHKPLVQIIFGVVEPDSDLQSIAVTNKTEYVIHYSEESPASNSNIIQSYENSII